MLTEKLIRSLEKKDKEYLKHDEKGLYISIPPTGALRWRFKYVIDGKRNQKSLGQYPEVSLKEAREKRDVYRKQINDTNTLTPPKPTKKVYTVKSACLAYYAKNEKSWTEKHAMNVMQRMSDYVFPVIGCLDIGDVDTPTAYKAVERLITDGKIDTAWKVKGILNSTFNYAIAFGKVKFNPTPPMDQLMPSKPQNEFPTMRSPRKVGALLRAIDSYEGTEYIRIALQLMALFFVRPGNLRQAEWSEFDMNANLWRIPPKKMKNKEGHIVPLAKQAVKLLARLKVLTGDGKYLFPSILDKKRPISDNTFNTAFKRCGYTSEEISPHGCRHMASTKLHGMGERSEVIEKQMAHTDRNKIRATYNKAEYMPERVAMMQRWADSLDEYRSK